MNTRPAQHPAADHHPARPILKWAGGKTQLLPDLQTKLPASFHRYIEPFFGGGALFFTMEPQNAVIADVNPELVNLYRAVAASPDAVIDALTGYVNTAEAFYEARAVDWRTLDSPGAAARMIYLNKTCFNGLYRVNRRGEFNVPYGRYSDPKIVDPEAIYNAARALSRAMIVEGDYKTVLREHARSGDLVFLDPPYLPVGQYSDFKRYTKEQFYEDDHRDLALEVRRLQELGAHVILTNSNHPLVHELFSGYDIQVVQTKRHISSSAASRRGEDVIVTAPPVRRLNLRLLPEPIDVQTAKFPATRYMGSKSKLLSEIWNVARQFDFDTAVDLFSGSGVVSYMLKAKGKQVVSNDYMHMASTYARALIENDFVTLSDDAARALVDTDWANDGFVARTFSGLYFGDEDNRLIDSLRSGIGQLKDPYEHAIAMTALIRTCLKKRPRGIFTYVGNRYDDGRKDLTRTFRDHFLAAVREVNAAVFQGEGPHSVARNGDAMTAKSRQNALVYIDPPYYTPLGDNEYVRRYHFVEGLARNWDGVEIQEHTLTKKFQSYPTPFSSRLGAAEAFDKLFRTHRQSILLVSYSSNSLPSKDELISLMNAYKAHVDVVPIDYRYSFGTQGHRVGKNNNQVKEFLFVGY